MQIVIQVEQGLQKDLRSGVATTSTSSLLELAERFGVNVTPQHDNDADSTLACFFVVNVPPDRAERFRARAMECSGVTAAYIKPQDELP